MTTQTLFFIILAGIIAFCVSFFFYFYKSSGFTKRNIFFSLLRFLSLFALFLLIINPTFERINYETIKPVLAIAVDNSASIAYLNQKDSVNQVVEDLSQNKTLNERFDIDFYQLGVSLTKLDSLSFDQGQTNLAQPLNTFSQLYKSEYAPLIISDGNATFGQDYEYLAQSLKKPTYFLAVGDTTTYEDLKIERINVNRYAYLDNEFPVEIVASYTGNKAQETRLEVYNGKQKVFSKNLNFSPGNTGSVVNFYLGATNVGVKQFNARLIPVENEKNKINNEKNFGVEVIDQKAKIAILYSYLHPDLGTLKKAIEGNRLRSAELIDIKNFQLSKIQDYDLVILFEPNTSFQNVYASLEKLNKNRFTIAAARTDFNFLNAEQKTFTNTSSHQSDEVQPTLNTNFTAFLVEDPGFANFPPLISAFGQTIINGDSDVLLYKKIAGIMTNDPLLVVTQTASRREVVLLGTGLWKWRAQSFIENQSFEAFDSFLDKLIQFSVSTEKRDRLQLAYESFYYGSSNVLIRAQYVDDNYIFDPKVNLTVIATNTETQQNTEVPFVLKGNFYAANLNMLAPDNYDFTVRVVDKNIQKKGDFTIIPYDIERQVQNAQWAKMETTSIQTGGITALLKNSDQLVDELLNNKRYTPTQKTVKNVVPLIDIKLLLFIIVACLAIEWFARKYNGLI